MATADIVRQVMLRHMKEVSAEEAQACDDSDLDKEAALTRDVLTYLLRLEERVVPDLNVPAFECLEQGTFLCNVRQLSETHRFLSGTLAKYDLEHSTCSRLQLEGLGARQELEDDVNEIGDLPYEAINEALRTAIENIDPEVVSSTVALCFRLGRLERDTCDILGCESFPAVSGGLSLLHYLQSTDAICIQESLDSLYAIPSGGMIEGVEGLSDRAGGGTAMPPISEKILLLALGQFSQQQADVSSLRHLSLLDELTDFAMDAFQCSLKHAKALAAQITRERSTSRTDSDKSTILRFDMMLLAAATNEESLTTTANDSYRQQAVAVLSQVPLGCSCAEHALWSDMFMYTVNPGQAVSLLDFLSDEQETLMGRRADVVYMVTANGDAIPVEKASPPKERVMGCVEGKEWNVLGSWCFAAAVRLSGFAAAEFERALRLKLLTIHEQAGAMGMQSLLSICVDITASVALPARGFVLKCLTTIVASCADIDSSRVQHKLMVYAKSSPHPRDTVRVVIGAAAQLSFIQRDRFLDVILSHAADLIHQEVTSEVPVAAEEEERESHLGMTYTMSGTVNEDLDTISFLEFDGDGDDNKAEERTALCCEKGRVWIHWSERHRVSRFFF